MIHHKSVKYVPFEMYNLFARIAYYCDIKYETLRDKISIIHYAWYKPWDGKVTHYNLEKLWWDYAKLTPFYIELATSFIDETISDNNAEKQIRELTEQGKR